MQTQEGYAVFYAFGGAVILVFLVLGVTLFGIFLTPVFYYVIQGLTEWSEGTSKIHHQ